MRVFRVIQRLLPVCAVACLAVGCGSSTATYSPLTEVQPIDESTEANGVGGPATVNSTDKLDSLEHVGPDELVGIALKRHPSIKAASTKVQRISETVEQASSLPDPMYSVSAGDMAQTAAGQVEFMTGVSQKVPYPGKLAGEGRIAEQQIQVARAELDSVKWRVATSVRRAYWSRYFADHAIDVTGQSRKLLEQFQQIAETKLRAGRAKQQDVLRISVELSSLDQDILNFQRERVIASAQLNTLLDRPVDQPLPDPKDVDFVKTTMELDTLVAQATKSHPSIDAAKAMSAIARERMKLARLSGRPDVSLGVSYAAVDEEGLSPLANGNDQWWVNVGVSMPIWRGRVDAAKREALHGIGESMQRLRAARNQVVFDVQDAVTRVQTQQQLIALFKEQIIPETKQTVDVSMAGYVSGNVDFLTLIDNWRKLLSVQLMLERNVTLLHQSLADLRAAIGKDLVNDNQRSAP